MLQVKLEVYPWGIRLYAESRLENEKITEWIKLSRDHRPYINSGWKGNPDWDPSGGEEHISINFTSQSTIPPQPNENP